MKHQSPFTTPQSEIESKMTTKQALLIIGTAAAAVFIDYKAYKAVTRRTNMAESVFLAPVNVVSAGLKLFNKDDRKNGVEYLGYLGARSVFTSIVRWVIRKIGA